MSSGHSKRPTIYTRDEHIVSRTDIDPDCLKVMGRLNHQGYKAYLVGGGVRDLLLGKKPKDFDVSTDATPKEIKKLFYNARIIGRRFKLVHMIFPDGKVIQVSTFRDYTPQEENTEQPQEENQEEGGSEEDTSKTLIEDNTFGTPETDAYRRDLTINGLFYSLEDFSVIDYVGGMDDLKGKIVRIIGDPKERFAEDPVRMIRAVRHAVRAGFTIEAQCLEAIKQNVHYLSKVPVVRLYEEIKKDLLSGALLPIFLKLREVGLLAELFPGLSKRPGALEREECRLALHTVDTFIQGGQTISHIIPLAIITLFAGFSEPDHEFTFNKNFDAMKHLERALAGVQVPRREKECLEDFLTWWAKLSQETLTLKLTTLARSQHLEQFKVFATILSIAGIQGPVLVRVGEALALAKKNPPPPRHDRHHPRRRYSPRPPRRS